MEKEITKDEMIIDLVTWTNNLQKGVLISLLDIDDEYERREKHKLFITGLKQLCMEFFPADGGQCQRGFHLDQSGCCVPD